MENEDEIFWKLNLKDLCNHRLLSQDEEVAIFKQIGQSNDPDEIKRLRNVVISHNGRLVAFVALRYKNYYGIQPRELAQEGVLGLIRATKKFDYKRGYKFSTYAIRWIEQAIGRAIAIQGRTIRIPVYKHDMYHRWIDLCAELPGLSVEEQAELLNTSTAVIGQLATFGPGPLSLDASPFVDDDTDNGHDSIADTYNFIADETATVDYDDTRSKLERKLAMLKPREEKILRLRFGLDDGVSRTLQQVAEMFSLTRERIRQIEKGALEKLSRDESLRELL